MARTGVTYDLVANAAAAIQARGKSPTINAVRAELGNTGSYTTISQHLATWRNDTADHITPKDLPEEAENAAMVAITKIWNIATTYADRDTAAMRQALADEELKHTAELQDALAEIATLEAELDRQEHRTREIEARANETLITHTKTLGQVIQLEKQLLTLQGAQKATAEDDKTLAHPTTTKPARGKKLAPVIVR